MCSPHKTRMAQTLKYLWVPPRTWSSRWRTVSTECTVATPRAKNLGQGPRTALGKGVRPQGAPLEPILCFWKPAELWHLLVCFFPMFSFTPFSVKPHDCHHSEHSRRGRRSLISKPPVPLFAWKETLTKFRIPGCYSSLVDPYLWDYFLFYTLNGVK